MPCISKVHGIISITHYLLAQAAESLTGMSVIKVIRTAYIIRYQEQCPKASPGIACILHLKVLIPRYLFIKVFRYLISEQLIVSLYPVCQFTSAFLQLRPADCKKVFSALFSKAVMWCKQKLRNPERQY